MTYLFHHENWLHAGNILFLLAYLVRDILWLRILTVVATTSLIAYYMCCSLTAPMKWNALFIAVNLVQIALLIVERRPVFLGEDELRMYRTVFRTLKPREFVKLMSIAEWKRATEGEELLRQGEPVVNLALISTGRGGVEIDGKDIADVGPGQFVGEMGFLTERDASASVIARLPTEYLVWSTTKLHELLDDAPQLHAKLQGVLGVDLVEKLRKEGFAAAHPSQLMGGNPLEGAEE